ncbi:unnamed protein product [Vitrella brassicaformis CCMP3155]|uniref:Trafficking protein particle complex subunit n=1 Tax=Vitrella brassicaformis (strain CCMP3155) TaxID=1169540 RepID=A0A0G4EH90_VITBC|nr:unnamed protein product [Vitrella brassicaformis CCMP3155]|mmetsp:Transcript_39254/g.98187  ORF Transcript_39254/g.98187 Transcript_39254/m.98187 type:complete len:137 (-) Transcript_39254:278-688(-)|eukprot:CEL95851.1 unnamed protein product [Vitrella brassicaformis CCMP3155]
MATVYVFVIVGKGDQLLYEADLSSAGKRDDSPHLDQFILHAALDMVDAQVFHTQQMYLKLVDKFNEFFVSGYVTAGHIKLMLLHKHRNEDNIKNFFQEVHDLYIRTLLNPFYEVNRPIYSSGFDKRVKQAGKKYLT